jgi:hypothetical protein
MDGVVGRFTLTRSLASGPDSLKLAPAGASTSASSTHPRVTGDFDARSGIVERRTDVDRAFDFTLLR